MKKFITAILCLMLAGAVSVNAYAKITTVKAVFGDMTITVNGKEYNIKPLIIDGRSYFPVRTLGYLLNCEVSWVDETREIILTSSDGEVEDGSFSQTAAELAGTQTAVFDDSIYLIADRTLITEPVAIVNDRSYIPVRAVADAMGKSADWDESTRTIEITNTGETQADNSEADKADEAESAEVVVDDEIEDYYVSAPDEITSDEDNFIGNWQGSVISYFSSGSFRIGDDRFFISKNEDGSYKIIYMGITTDCTGTVFKVGDIRIVELTGSYDSETNSMTTTYVRDIYNNSNSKGYNSDTFIYENDKLYLTNGLDDGNAKAELERF
ncbi:MAG: copper amine oxidase N-terminal domain-containing protein [Eubacterium sp.]|nr:copper amine oxidase N-terminal domain-containing protein [Eubacterium sp.]